MIIHKPDFVFVILKCLNVKDKTVFFDPYDNNKVACQQRS